MKKIKFVSLGVLLLGSVAFGGSHVGDMQITIPFSDVAVGPLEMLSVLIPVNQMNGSDITCSLSVAAASHPTINVLLTSANMCYNPNDSQDGDYQIVGNNISYIYKFKVQQLNPGLPIYMRFSQAPGGTDQEFTVSCKYS